MTAEAKNKDGEPLKINSKQTLAPNDKNDLDLSFIEISVPIESNVDDATVLLNGQNVGQLKDGKGTLGPILFAKGMTIQLEKKTDDGKLTTATYAVKEGEFVKKDAAELALIFEQANATDVENNLNVFYNDVANSVTTDSSYNQTNFSKKYYLNGEKNKAFKALDTYIKDSRKSFDKQEYAGVLFDVKVTSVTATADDSYTVDYHVDYNTSYLDSTGKEATKQGYDYSHVKIKLAYDKAKSSWTFMFADMGDNSTKTE